MRRTGNLIAQLALFPGDFVVSRAEITGEDHRATIWMLVNSLFWELLSITLVFIFAGQTGRRELFMGLVQ
jgi:hypothetical protein